jgi:hypothetical protein
VARSGSHEDETQRDREAFAVLLREMYTSIWEQAREHGILLPPGGSE